MPNINLVSTRRDEKRQITTLSRQLFMGLIAAGLILVVTIITVEGEKFSKRNEIKALDTKMGELQPKLDRIKQREADINALKPKVDTLDNARLSTLRWRTFMSVLATATPSMVYITKASTGTDSAGATVSLQGIAPSQSIVADVAHNLFNGGRSMFSDVEITSTRNGSVPEDPVQKISFDMNLYLRPVSLPGATSTLPATAPATTTTKP